MKKDKTIKEELKTVAPILAKAKNEESTTATNFDFVQMQQSVLDKIRTEEVAAELKSFSSVLYSVEKKTETAPNALYFEAMQQKVFAGINLQTKAKLESAFSIWLNQLSESVEAWFSPQARLAFSVLLAGVLITTIFLTQINPEPEFNFAQQMDSISDDEIQNYLAMNIDEFELNTITENAEFGETAQMIGNTEEWNKTIEDFIFDEADGDLLENEYDLI